MLRRYDKPFDTTNSLHELVGASQPALVKIFVGQDAQKRRDTESARLAAWREAGFLVPRQLDYEVPEADGPFLVLEHLQGENLMSLLRDPDRSLADKLATWPEVLMAVRLRHDRAMADERPDLIHPDSSTGNIILTPSGPALVDLEAPPKFSDVADGAAVELAKLCRWAVRDVGIDNRKLMLREILKVYHDRRDLLDSIVRRTAGRPMQFFHRRRDRAKKARLPADVTKYDIADGLKALLDKEDISGRGAACRE